MDIRKRFNQILNKYSYREYDYTEIFDSFILPSYEEENRHYHNWEHIEKCIETLNSVRMSSNTNWRNSFDYDAIFIALVFHDIIYDVTYSNNELLSEHAVFITLRSTPLDLKLIREVQRLIAQTTHYQAEPHQMDHLSMIIRDVDLAGLSASPKEFQRNSDLVEKEFRSVFSEKEFLKGRIKWVKRMLRRRNIYTSKFVPQTCTAIARLNLVAHKRELSRRLRVLRWWYLLVKNLP